MKAATAHPAAYAELQVATAFSFLEGASRPEELAATAAVLGLAAVGITDLNTVAGVVRLHAACRQTGVRVLPGARLRFRDGTPDILCYPTGRAAWGRLTRLLTTGKRRAKHGDTSDEAKRLNRCLLDYADLLEHAEGQVLIAVPPPKLDEGFAQALHRLHRDCPREAYVAATRRHGADDARRLRTLAAGPLPMAATNDVLYHAPERRPLQDVMTCIRLGCRIDTAGRALHPNAERHLKSPAEMARLFARHPDALRNGLAIAERCRFSLDELAYEYPDEPVPPGKTPDRHLADLTWQGAAVRLPVARLQEFRATIEKELRVIAALGYARYFLTVHDVVRYARGQGILCQGRGSSANSIVCFCLGITSVDPTEINLLFERFVSVERREPPDIDVDFEHERREQVIQYIYDRYGRHRAGIAATVIHYRPKSAIREVGKVMGLSEDATAALAGQSWDSGDTLWSDARIAEVGLAADSAVVRQTVALARELIGLPRHLSQHVGGFVLTRGRLDETVPIGNAAMDARTFIEWDKDDIDALGMMKVDVLALGMLTCIKKAFGLLGIADMTEVPRECPEVYAMLTKGDSIGVFQVESRAQMNMLPRLRPRAFYDLVIEVAIVRPGPIQGDMVHPYLRRRQGLETVSFPSPSPEHGSPDELQKVLGRTLGVPLFQEQAMRIAIDAAGFTPEQANELRRAMATFRHVGTIHKFYAKMVEGMVSRGYAREFAERCFKQIEGFGTYGFPESHAAAFAWLVYISAWLKCFHPAHFACALLNSQPMGFYAPAQIVRDARDHGVSVRGIDVNESVWDCTIEAGGALRLGLRLIRGFREDWATVIAAARRASPHPCPPPQGGRERGSRQKPSPLAGEGREGGLTIPDLARLGLPQAALLALAEADALQNLGLDRRQAAWHVQGLQNLDLPLFAALPHEAGDAVLPHMPAGERVIADYRATALSLAAHPMRFLRTKLTRRGLATCADVASRADGTEALVAGIVLVRQRPGNGNVVFCTIEDETGILNVVVWASLLEKYRRAVVASSLLQVRGRVQRSVMPDAADRSKGSEVVHLVAEELHDASAELPHVGDEAEQTTMAVTANADEMPSLRHRPASHPRHASVIPRSRDFH